MKQTHRLWLFLLLLPAALMLLALRPGLTASGFATAEQPAAPSDSDQWQEIDASAGPGPRSGASAVNINGNIYIFGGLKPGNPEPENDLWEYDAETNNWGEILASPAPPGRYNYTAVARDGKMIVFGGTGANGQPLGDAPGCSS